MATEDDITRAARQAWGDRFIWSHEFGSAEGRRMKDVTPPHQQPPTPKPRPRTVQLHENKHAGKGCYEIMMPNGQYLAGADGFPYLLRFKGGYDNAARRETTVEKFTKVYDNFRRFWP